MAASDRSRTGSNRQAAAWSGAFLLPNREGDHRPEAALDPTPMRAAGADRREHARPKSSIFKHPSLAGQVQSMVEARRRQLHGLGG